MEEKALFTVIIKVFLMTLLFIYFLVGVLITRQVFLMNRAIKTKLAGLLNCLAIIHVFLIIFVLLIILIV